MKATVGFVLLALACGVVAFFALAHLFVAYMRRRPDPALTLQTPQVKFRGYDESKAVAAAKRAGQTAAQMAEQDRLLNLKKNPLQIRRRA